MEKAQYSALALSQHNNLVSYFSLHKIDIPRCFKISKSLYSRSNSLFIRDLVTYLTFSGNKTRILTILNTILNTPASSLGSNLLALTQILMPATHFLSLGYNNLTGANSQALHSISLTPDLNNASMLKLSKSIHSFRPIFMFYIYKVDKAIYKNSRGKSGKFTFLWKYVAPYKRSRLIMYWFNKEVKSCKGINFKSRLNSTLLKYATSPKETFIFKARKFSYNYVYSNHKLGLASTYRTTNR